MSAADRRPHPSVFLSGNGAPIGEEYDLDELEVHGTIPPGLSGVFYRIGANPQFEPFAPYHFFEGDGMLHAFFIRDGCVSYRNRWVRTARFAAERRAGKTLFGLMRTAGQSDRRALFGLSGSGMLRFLWQLFIKRDHRLLMESVTAANTSPVFHAGRLWATFEMSTPTRIDPSTLETLGLERLGQGYRGPFTAHPKADPDTGELFAFGYSTSKPYGHYHIIDKRGNLRHTRSLQLPYATMMHDFAVTKEYAVFLLFPARVKIDLSVGMPITWAPELGTKIAIMPRAGDGPLTWLETDACFAFHVLNAWSEGDQVTIDMVKMARFPEQLIDPAGDSRLDLDSLGKLTRWHLDLTAGTVRETPLDAEHRCEFPRFDERFAMRAHRYGYVAGLVGETTGTWLSNSVIAYDLQRETKRIHRFGDDVYTTEPVFAPASEDAPEGHGYVICGVYREREDRSDLVILDGRDVESDPLAVIRLPHRMPHGFHSAWVDGRHVYH